MGTKLTKRTLYRAAKYLDLYPPPLPSPVLLHCLFPPHAPELLSVVTPVWRLIAREGSSGDLIASQPMICALPSLEAGNILTCEKVEAVLQVKTTASARARARTWRLTNWCGETESETMAVRGN